MLCATPLCSSFSEVEDKLMPIHAKVMACWAELSAVVLIRAMT